MSRFYVGQRVRIRYVIDRGNWGRYEGGECTIRKFVAKDRFGHDCEVALSDGTRTLAGTCQLEPLTDSYDVTSWDSCVWKPEHLRVGA